MTMVRSIEHSCEDFARVLTAETVQDMSDKLCAADRLGFTTYNPRHVPAIQTLIDLPDALSPHCDWWQRTGQGIAFDSGGLWQLVHSVYVGH